MWSSAKCHLTFRLLTVTFASLLLKFHGVRWLLLDLVAWPLVLLETNGQRCFSSMNVKLSVRHAFPASILLIQHCSQKLKSLLVKTFHCLGEIVWVSNVSEISTEHYLWFVAIPFIPNYQYPTSNISKIYMQTWESLLKCSKYIFLWLSLIKQKAKQVTIYNILYAVQLQPWLIILISKFFCRPFVIQKSKNTHNQ